MAEQATQTKPAQTPAPVQGAGATAPKPSKAQKFKELAENRTTKAMNAIATLRGLANKNNYEYNEDQVSKILGALRGEIDTLEQSFKGKGPAKAGFSL